ncbi:uncharacterized protein LOC109813910 [Cajanus cajan]|uniref:DUF659 domain-containing protein n=1 Tax=Cajanus cajan TaxID=3821 RepID=A0A151S1I7_CAJCA|nr:uncharacterized protein LOC109813910 [Cajanus cajan]KYP48649.1 hypothetical protein KK1_029629 [Cajanus cajan]
MAKRKGKELESAVKRRSKSIESSTNVDLREEACKQIARFFYINAIPLNVAKSDPFQGMWNYIAPGFKPPSYHDLKGKYLKQQVAEIKESMEGHKATWKRTGCSILIDDWTNTNGVTICNFYVNSPEGTVFLKSVNASEICKTVDGILKMMDDIVEEVGEENVVQVVTRNDSNYKAAGKMLVGKRKRLFWMPCVIDSINLMLEDFVMKLRIHGDTVANGRRITSYIYSRSALIGLLHHFTKGKDLVKPGVTKFATCYLTLKCLYENKGALVNMFSSKQWKCSFFAGTTCGKLAKSVVMDDKFWKNILVCLKGANPLIKVLQMVSSNSNTKPAIGFIYDEMKQAKEKIQQAFKCVKKRYMPLWAIIDGRWDRNILGPLHATAYYLNPQFHYSTNFKEDFDVKLGLYGSLCKMVAKQDWSKVEPMLEDFKHAKNYFGHDLAKRAIKTKNPADWWDSYGFEYSELQHFAIRVLSLTTYCFGCEDNRKAFDRVHLKKRNRLKQKTLNDVMLVMSNSKLAERHQAGKAIEYSMDDLSSDDEWITEIDGSSFDDEESELDELCFYFPNEDDKLKGQVGVDANCDGAYIDDLHIPDDDEADVNFEDGASNATDDVMDGDESYMEDESCHDFDVNEFLL